MNDWMIENLGLTLIHSLWQIGFLTLILFLAFRILQNATAGFRYLISILALFLSLALPVATFIYLSSDSKTANPVRPSPPVTKSEPVFQSSEALDISHHSPATTINSTSKNSHSVSSNFQVLPLLAILWLIGVLFFSIRLLGGFWTIHTYRTRNIFAVSHEWQKTFDELCKNLQIKPQVRFFRSEKVEMPVVIGWLKPVILIPAGAFLNIPPNELEAILIHELIHISRRDYLVNLIQSSVEVLLFYHPGVWWISARIKEEREFAVDEFVSQIFERERFVYANALANLEQSRLDSKQLTPTLAMAGNGGNLMERIEKILQGNRKINSRNISIWSAVFALTFIVGITAGFYWLKTTGELKKSKSGRKVAVVFSNSLAMFSEYLAKERGNRHYQKLLELQTKYQMPVTWTLDAGLIEELRKNGKAEEFFSQAHENNSNFMLYVPNISYTIFINGDDEYIATWKKRVQFVEENLAQNGDKLEFYLRPAQIPKEMEDFLINRGLSLGSSPNLDYGVRFSHAYEKECDKKMTSCQETTSEKRQEIRQKFINYVNESFELNQKFARAKSGTEVPQILTLNVDNLTADSADELLQTLKENGYEFVPLEEVQSQEMIKLRADLTKDREFMHQKLKIQQKYEIGWLNITKEELEAIKTKVLENGKKTTFNVEINTKNFKVKVKE